MSDQVAFDLRRALLYIAAATGLAVIIGSLRYGTIGGGIALGLAIGIGATIGIGFLEGVSRYRNR
ncbi:hypothetical protein HAL_31960 [Haladaptatus sp. T7]|nr:hypothetical protein HAL_31960 [Haladaptatus sp. T7]